MEVTKITSSVTKKAKIIILIILGVLLWIAIVSLIANITAYNDYWDRYHYFFSTSFFDFPYIYISIVLFVGAIISLIMYLMVHKMQITVTDKRVTGKTSFGRNVDLPVDSISAIGSSMFNGIAVATSSGKIAFIFMENSDQVRKELCDLLIKRQDAAKVVEERPYNQPNSTTDELKKYKELLDGGIITQEEFDQKKKQLLGL